MAPDIFFSDDVRQALQAADEACLSTARVCAAGSGDQATLRAYLEGYRAALRTIALAFGLEPAVITARGEVLEAESWTVGESLPSAERPSAIHPMI